MRNNNVQLIGYVGKDLSMQVIPNGNKRVYLRVATHYVYKNEQGDKVFNTVWHDVIAWGKVGEFAENNFVKGSRVMVNGSIQYRTLPDSDGHTRHITTVKAHYLINLDR